MLDLSPTELSRFTAYLAQELTAEESAEVRGWIAERADLQIFVEYVGASRLDCRAGPMDTELPLQQRVEMIAAALAEITGRSGSMDVASQRGERSLVESSLVESSLVESSLVESALVESALVRPSLRGGLGARGWGGGFKARTLRRGIWSTAALLAIIVTIGSWNAKEFHIGRRAVASMMTYATGNGERATIALPDGGTAVLNVASRLEVPMDYMSGHRTVRLVGEGLFTVSHRAKTPFTVVAGGTTARVLGTSFVMRHYGTDTATMVAVHDGRVTVDTTVMTANQLAEFGKNVVTHIRLSDGSPFSFATGTLTIDGLPLPAAIVELDRWYDADIRLGDPTLASRRVNATFAAGSLSELAENLGALYDVRVVRDGRVLTLNPKR